MLFDKRIITCKTKQNQKIFTHTIEYHKALVKIDDAHYRIIKAIAGDKDIIIDIDTTLFPPYTRLNPSEYVEELQKKLAANEIKYRISRAKKEVLDAGLGRIFGMKSSKVDTAYRISLYIPQEAFTYECYKNLLDDTGYRVCILNFESNVDELLELFYSGMIDDLDFTQVFYAHFYCNEQLAQLVLASHHMDGAQVNSLLDGII